MCCHTEGFGDTDKVQQRGQSPDQSGLLLYYYYVGHTDNF